MRVKLFILFITISTAGFSQTADDIINKSFEATGGKEKWARVNSLRYLGNYVMGPGMLAPVSEMSVGKPFRGYYFDFSWQGMTSKTVMRGDTGWSYNPFGGKRDADPLSPNDIRDLKLDADPQGLLLNYKEKGYTVDYLGTDDMDGSDVYKLRLNTREGDMVYFYIDAETYYILKEVKRIKLKDKEEKDGTTFSDFKKTDYGIVVPFSVQRIDDQGNESGGPVVYSKVEINGVVDPAVFDQPKSK